MLKKIIALLLLEIISPFSAIIGQTYRNQYLLNSFVTSNIEHKLTQVDEFNSLNSFIYLKNQRKPKITGGIKKIDSIIVNSVFGLKDKLTFVYDESGRIISYKAASYLKNESYVDVWQNIITYNSFGNPEVVLHSVWDGKKWDNDRLEDFVYSSDGKVILSLNQVWQDSSWVNYLRVTTSYDSEEKLVTFTTEKWGDSVWVNLYKTTTEYFLDSLKSANLFQEWQNNRWEDKRFSVFEYNNENKVASITAYDWDGITWNPYLKMTVNYYSAEFQSTKLVEFWDTGRWLNLYRNSETYTLDNYFTHGIFDLWTNDKWLPADGPIHLYNPDGFELHYLTHEMYVYYNETTNIKEGMANYLNEYKLFQNFPNPFNPSTTISYQIPSISFITLKVYDVLGNEVATLVNEWKEAGSYSAQFTTSGKQLASGMSSKGGYASGVYFYTLTAGKFTDTKKFILMK